MTNIHSNNDLTKSPPQSFTLKEPNWLAEMKRINQSDFTIRELAKALVDLSKPLPEPEVAVWGSRDGAYCVPLSTLGNLSMIIGKAKSRKTFYWGWLAAAALQNSGVGPFKGGDTGLKKRVIAIDTEQGAYHVQKTGKRVCRLVGAEDHELFDMYSFRKFNIEERIALLRALLYSTPDLKLVIIDGVRDLLRDVNNPAESYDLAHLLSTWAEELNIHILCVLHQNKGDNNARGHLGNEMVNKSEFITSVSLDPKNPSVSITKTECGRELGPDPITFTIDENGLPVALTDFHSLSVDIKNPDDLDEATHRDILMQAFSQNDKPKYKEFCLLLEEGLIHRGYSFSKTKISTLPKFYISQGWISLEGVAGTRHSYYQFEELLEEELLS